ncbi:hypothetical protein ACFY1P_34030 [Streptomyces sp. NPDC001407]|uniref:hypothetical protein n=1 Tax=Streptomyces sp. NPDC001407 TaxID=3364573 RepID=UPI0036C36BC8
MSKPPTPPSRQAVRRKIALGFEVGAILILGASVPLLGAPLWATLLCAVVTVFSLQLTSMQWALIRRSAPLLPLLDAIAPYTRDMVPGHGRAFDRIGADSAVLCIAGRRAANRTFLRASEDDLRSLADSAPGDHVRVVSDQITIMGPIAVQYTVVDSADPADPLASHTLSLYQRFAMSRINAKTGVLHPTTADMAALLHHLENSDLVKDINPPAAEDRN